MEGVMDWLMLFSLLLPAAVLIVSVLRPGYLKRWISTVSAAELAILLAPLAMFGITGAWELWLFWLNPGAPYVQTSRIIFYLEYAAFGVGLAVAWYRMRLQGRYAQTRKSKE
jgi:hypothetical protein